MIEWWHVPTWRGQTLKSCEWPPKTQIRAPLKWRVPRVVLLPDIFQDDLPAVTGHATLSVVTRCPQHLFLVVTKRPEYAPDNLPPNLWLGAHVETQAEADQIVPKILEAPAALRFVHVTPRESIHLDNVGGRCVDHHNALTGEWDNDLDDVGSSTLSKWTNKLDWVVCEGRADPMRPDWVRSLRDQCVGADVPFSFAGWGKMLPWEDWVTDEDEQAAKCVITVPHSNSPGVTRYLFMGNHRHSGRLLDGVEHNAFPKERA